MRPFSTCLLDSIDFTTLNFAEVSYGTTRAISNWDKLTRVRERTSTLRRCMNDNHPAPASTEAIAVAARQRHPLHSSPRVSIPSVVPYFRMSQWCSQSNRHIRCLCETLLHANRSQTLGIVLFTVINYFVNNHANLE